MPDVNKVHRRRHCDFVVLSTFNIGHRMGFAFTIPEIRMSSRPETTRVSDAAFEPAPSRRDQWLVLAAAFLGWMFDGMEMGIFPLVARPALQTMLPMSAALSPDQFIGTWMGRITALFLVGAALGGLVFGWIGDRIGRVRAMTLSVLTYSLFSGACFFAHVPWHLGFFRFIASIGMGGEWSLGVALVMETWPRDKRPLLAGIIGAASNAGYMLIASFGLYFKASQSTWRWFMLIGALPASLALLIQVFVPESKRWKAATAVAPANRPMREIFSGRLLTPTLLGIAFASIALIGTWGTVQWLPLWADQLTSGKLPAAKAATQLLSATGAIVGCVLGALFAGKFGRRIAYFLLCAGSLIVCAVLFRCISAYNSVFLGLVFLTGAITAAFYGWFPLYLPELFPTRVRATGQGVAYNFGRILAAVGALVQGKLVANYSGSYARAGAAVSLVYILGLVLIWFAPETKDRPLPD